MVENQTSNKVPTYVNSSTDESESSSSIRPAATAEGEEIGGGN
jgi:hypothetical protein